MASVTCLSLQGSAGPSSRDRNRQTPGPPGATCASAAPASSQADLTMAPFTRRGAGPARSLRGDVPGPRAWGGRLETGEWLLRLGELKELSAPSTTRCQGTASGVVL
nr:uncharacterized protein LOC123285745 isoform X2 [Equus asinus]